MTGTQVFKQASSELYPLIIQSLSDQKSTKYNDNAWTFAELDNWKRKELPALVQSRYAEKGDTWITKDELILLMDWKLAKGKFRPTLPKLIRQNEADHVESVTKGAFKKLLSVIAKLPYPIESSSDKTLYLSTVKDCTKQVSELRGVGPATASLILSLVEPISKLAPPFFSDESFIYFVIEPTRPGTKIKYNLKEYTDEFLPVLLELSSEKSKKKSDTPSILEIENGAWALKYYDLGRIDVTADIKVPFEVDQAAYFKHIKSEAKEEAKDKTQAKKVAKPKVKSSPEIKEESKKKRQKKN